MMKKEVKLFFLTDFEEEEDYLAAMHRKGWRFKEIRFGCLFVFEPCRPEEVVYRLDFKPRLGEDREVYEQLYADYGWECVGVGNNFAYFRKAVTDGEAVDIYSDRQTKLDMIRQIFKWRFVAVVLMGLTVFWQALYPRDVNDWSLWMWRVLASAYLFVLLHCGLGFYKLRKRYEERG
ncbi:hypothetical protein BU202_08915 [Streptococcus cuniculi]|uniref:DUF2812 domain-containing protein n=1 Tax=Streptococcus cuniculi TaxID=1432788 RepID=A0A1Q8E5W4_9STRE|nr:DUF2812 domain-containing protein [Streptococcus cuniculi]OLF47191.1 hypothetical protein BU202_08915 [Streptococcus cuniculi]